MAKPPPDHCRHCGSIDIDHLPHDKPPHHGKFVCHDCGKQLAWSPKPPGERGSDRPRGNRSLLAVCVNNQFCENCLTLATHVPGGWPLEVHHIIPIEIDGTDDPANLRVLCHDCHLQAHFERDRARRRDPSGVYGLTGVSLADLVRGR